MTTLRALAAAALLVAAAGPAAAADWWTVAAEDADFDLPAARRAALDVVAEQPRSADAVAAAGWWWHQLSNLADPEEILTVAGNDRDPELGFLLARIEAELDGRPPAGAIGTAELAGPFGVFETLDLDRGRAPADTELPPRNTPFVDARQPVRYTLTPLAARVTPPRALVRRGLFVLLWTFEIDGPFDGWLAVEGDGSFDLSVDGRRVDRRRECGLRDPGTAWYRVRFDGGAHRVRADLSARGRPEVRVSLHDDSGAPLSVRAIVGGTAPRWADSTVDRADPPAMAEHRRRLADDPTETGLLLAAEVMEQRRDPVAQRELVEQAAVVAPSSPWPRLAMSRYWLTAITLDDAEAIRRRARDQLRAAAEIPVALIYERALAVRERRNEDDERILEALVAGYPEDVRVTRLWIREALGRGWIREAEDGLRRLQFALPGSREVSKMELEVFEALERWNEREHLLRTLATAESADLNIVDELANGCLITEAVSVVERLRSRADDPDLDVELGRLLYSAGRLDAAAAHVEEIRRRWGSLRVVDELALAITAGEPATNARVLDATLQRAPSAVELLSLAWRRGATPFYEPYLVSVDEVAARVGDETDDVDAVLLLDQAVERVFPDGSSLYYYHGVTRALTPVGAQQAGRLQQLPNSHRLKVRIHKPDGSVVVPAGLGGNGAAVLDEVEPGDLVEEEYLTRVAPAATSMNGHLPPYIYRFADSERAFGLSEYLLLAPPEIELMVEGNFEGLERTEWTVDGLRAIRWRAESVPPVPEERFAPPTSELLPWVSYGFGVAWQDVGDALRDRLAPLLVTSPELRQWSRPLTTGDDPKAVVAALAEAIIDEVGPGRADLDFSSTAGASFSRKVGNRMGIIASVLIEAGWDVDLVMARTRPFAGTHLVVPTFDSFVLPVLRVQRDDTEVWLDLEQERQGIDRIDAMLQGSDGLQIPLNRVEAPVVLLSELPSFPNPDLEEEMRVDAVVASDGSAELAISLSIKGAQAERVMEQIRSVPTERVPLIYEQMATSFVPAAADVRGRVERVESGVVLELEMRAAGVCRREGDAMVCRSLVFAKPLAPVLASLPSRRFDLIMPVPVMQKNTLVITPPTGWVIEGRPRKIERPWGSVTESVDRPDGRHRSILRLELPAQTVAPADYPDFARFCHALDELASRPPVLIRAPAEGDDPS